MENAYQTRGIAYREYGIFKLQQNPGNYDKARGINSLKASIADLEKVLNDNPEDLIFLRSLRYPKKNWQQLPGITN
jgi:hypothetical protein